MIVYAQRVLPQTNKMETLVFYTLADALRFFGVYCLYDSVQKKLKRKHYYNVLSKVSYLPVGFNGHWTLTPEKE